MKNYGTFSIDDNGNYITNPKYKEIIRLHDMLNNAGIPHTFEKCFDGWQVCYPEKDERKPVADAIEHFGSYGQDKDLLEIMGLITQEDECGDSVLGYLTAEDVFQRMKKHWEVQKKEAKMPVNKGMFTSTTDLWETPQDFFDKLNDEFHFTLDVCALPENAKCKKYYTPNKTDFHNRGQGHAGAILRMGNKSNHGFAMRGHLLYWEQLLLCCFQQERIQDGFINTYTEKTELRSVSFRDV